MDLRIGSLSGFRPTVHSTAGRMAVPSDITPPDVYAGPSRGPSANIPLPPGAMPAFFALSAAPSPAAATALDALQRLEHNGVQLRKARKFLLWRREGWVPATPQDAAKLVEGQHGDQVQVKTPRGEWQPLDDLASLDAFYGTGDTSKLPEPALATALLALERDGATFASCTAQQAWDALHHGSLPLTLQHGGARIRLDDHEDAVMYAFSRGLVPASHLRAPQRAEGILAATRLGCEVPPYPSLRDAAPDDPVEITHDGFVADALTARDFDDPGLPARLRTQVDHLQTVRRTFAQPKQAWTLLAAPDAAHSFEERTRLLTRITELPSRDPFALYQAVMQQAASGEPLDEAAKDLLALAAALPPECSDEAAALYAALRSDPDRAAHLQRIVDAAPDFASAQAVLHLPRESRQRLLTEIAALDGAPRATLSKLAQRVQPWIGKGNVRVSPDGSSELDLVSDRYLQDHESLTARLALRDTRTATLVFEARHDLQMYDSCSVQASRDGGKTWRDLQKFEKGDGKPQSVRIDLTPYAGGDALIRFKQDRTYAADGFRAGSLILVTDRGAAPLHGEVARARVEPLLDLLENAGGQRDVLLHAVDVLSAKLDIDDATMAAPIVTRGVAGGSVLDARLDLFTRLAEGTDVAALSAAWPHLPVDDPAGLLETTKALTEKLDGDRGKAVHLLPCVARHPEDTEALLSAEKVVGPDVAALWPALEGSTLPWNARATLLKAAWRVGNQDRDGAMAQLARLVDEIRDERAVDAARRYSECVHGWKRGGQWSASGSAGERILMGGDNPRYQEHAALSSDTFVVPPGASLSFAEQHGFYSGDRCTLQISVAGGVWNDLVRFENNGEGPHRVDLGPYEGKTVTLRFSMDKTFDATTGIRLSNVNLVRPEGAEPLDGWICRHAAEALQSADPTDLADFTDAAGGEPLDGARLAAAFAPYLGQADARTRLLALVKCGGCDNAVAAGAALSALPAAQADAAVQAISTLKPGDVAMWELLIDHVGDPDFPERVDAVTALGQRVGPAAVARVWARLESLPGTPCDRVGLFELCHVLNGGDADLASLCASRVREIPTGAGRALRAFSHNLVDFSPEGHWSALVENGRSTWNCTADPGYQEHTSLTSPPLSLEGCPAPRLLFEASTQLYDADSLFVEGSADGNTWTQLAVMKGSKAWAPGAVSLAGLGTTPRVRFRVDKTFASGTGASCRGVTIDPGTAGPCASDTGEAGAHSPSSGAGFAAGNAMSGIRYYANRGVVDAIMRIASESGASAEGRNTALAFLASLPNDAVTVVRQFCVEHAGDANFPSHTWSEIVGRLAEMSVLQGNENVAQHVEARLQSLLRGQVAPGSVEMTDQEVVIGGVRVPRKQEQPGPLP